MRPTLEYGRPWETLWTPEWVRGLVEAATVASQGGNRSARALAQYITLSDSTAAALHALMMGEARPALTADAQREQVEMQRFIVEWVDGRAIDDEAARMYWIGCLSASNVH